MTAEKRKRSCSSTLAGLFLLFNALVLAGWTMNRVLNGEKDNVTIVSQGVFAVMLLLAGWYKISGKMSFVRLFFLVGGLGFIGFSGYIAYNRSVPKLMQVAETREWREVPCTILSSEIEQERMSDGDSRRVARIRFRYMVGNKAYESNMIDVFWTDTGENTYHIVKQYPAGSETSCYVNPMNEREAALRKGFHSIHATAFLPLIITVMGLILIAASVYPERKQQ